MKQYRIKLFGSTPLIMHRDNLAFAEKISAWRLKPENKALSKKADDRTPPWTWIGYLYHDGRNVGIDSDNIMTLLREGGAKIQTGKGKETFKKQTQSGLMLDCQQFSLFVNEKELDVKKINDLIGELDFNEHLMFAENHGFELFVKRAKVNQSKHVRVRPMFRDWMATGKLTVLDEEVSGITGDVLRSILRQAGAVCGLCDWRPSSPSSGVFGRFTSEVEEI